MQTAILSITLLLMSMYLMVLLVMPSNLRTEYLFPKELTEPCVFRGPTEEVPRPAIGHSKKKKKKLTERVEYYKQIEEQGITEWMPPEIQRVCQLQKRTNQYEEKQP